MVARAQIARCARTEPDDAPRLAHDRLVALVAQLAGCSLAEARAAVREVTGEAVPEGREERLRVVARAMVRLRRQERS
jgi:hypothetical protein